MNIQMNVRIDSEVKRAGDEVFGNLGLTSSQVVRAVWEYAASHREAPQMVASALAPMHAQERSLEAEIAAASSVCARMRERFGIDAPPRSEDLDYEALREQALYERMEDRGLA